MVRTRTKLQEALFELAHERGFSSISVSDVAERAGVNRSTFYQHYADLDTVLADALDRSAVEAGAGIVGFEELTVTPPPQLVAFLRHVDDHAGVYAEVLTGTSGAKAVLTRLTARIREAILIREKHLLNGALPMPVDVIAAGITGSIMGVLTAWLSIDPRPRPETAAEWIWALVLGPQPQGSEPPVDEQ